MKIIRKDEIDTLYKKANVSNEGSSIRTTINTGTMYNKLMHEMGTSLKKSGPYAGKPR